jgi:hypothetical protein
MSSSACSCCRQQVGISLPVSWPTGLPFGFAASTAVGGEQG